MYQPLSKWNRGRRKHSRGMTFLEVLAGMVLVGLFVLPMAYLLGTASRSYRHITAKKSIFPLADALKVAVALDMKTNFTTRKSNPPCSGNGRAFPLPSATPLRSGVSLKRYTKHDASALPQIPTFSLYSQAIEFCKGHPAAAPNELRYRRTSFAALPVGSSWDIFDAPVGNFGDYTSFDFCGTIECDGAQAGNKFCQYAENPQQPLLVVLRYVIRSATHGSVYSCNQTAEGWPADAVGELSYLFLWSQGQPGRQRVEHFADSGVFYANTAVVE